jgi:hypothetical protein
LAHRLDATSYDGHRVLTRSCRKSPLFQPREQPAPPRAVALEGATSGQWMAANMKPTARMPQGVMRLMMPEFEETFTPEAKQKIAHHALQLKSEKGDRSAYNYLIEKIGLDTSWGRDESDFNEAFNYVLALLYAYSGQPEKMAEHARLSKTMPSPDDDQLFSDHVNCSHVAREHQQRAISRGIGPVLIACQPRSASATLTHSLGRLFDIPVPHLSIGDFPNYYLAPSWLDMFLEGGAISQDHFGATEFNVGVLSSRGPRDLFVLVRDPRAAAASLVHYRSRQAWPIEEPFETIMERLCVERFIPRAGSTVPRMPLPLSRSIGSSPTRCDPI